MTDREIPGLGPTMAEHAPALVLTNDLDIVDVGSARFSSLVLAEGIPHIAVDNWPTAAATLDPLAEQAETTVRGDQGEWAFADLALELGAACYVHARLSRGRLHVVCAAFERDVLVAAEAWLLEQFPRVAPTKQQEVPVTFWSGSDCGGCSRSRTIAVPTWAEVQENYPSVVADRLSALLARCFVSRDAGQLILWHGEPGLGKTYVLRALAWEWRSWCDVHYIADPEVFFGTAEYMLDVLLEEDREANRWRVLILEDTGELLTADAKERTGQGLSRFLNVVDGILGQGLRVLVLVTTNEPLRRLHPAVSRPGRCAAQIEFRPFDASEAAAWLEARGVSASGSAPLTLASLYAAARGDSTPEARRHVGFGARGD